MSEDGNALALVAKVFESVIEVSINYNILFKQLNIANNALRKIRTGGCDTDAQIALDALVEIERINNAK